MLFKEKYNYINMNTSTIEKLRSNEIEEVMLMFSISC